MVLGNGVPRACPFVAHATAGVELPKATWYVRCFGCSTVHPLDSYASPTYNNIVA
jgi:hypothetical protein